MSDLKHRTPEELRQRIRGAQTRRAWAEKSIPVMERQIEDLQAAITEAKKTANNNWQIEVWAKYWLKEKVSA